MKLETKKKLAMFFLKIAKPFYNGGAKIKHNGINHYVINSESLKVKLKNK